MILTDISQGVLNPFPSKDWFTVSIIFCEMKIMGLKDVADNYSKK